MDFNYAVLCLQLTKYYRYTNAAYIIILLTPWSVICKASEWRSKILFLQDIAYFYLCYDIQKVLVVTYSVVQGVPLG